MQQHMPMSVVLVQHADYFNQVADPIMQWRDEATVGPLS